MTDPRPANWVLVVNALGIAIFTILLAAIAFEMAGMLIPYPHTLTALLGFLCGALGVVTLGFGGWAFWQFVGRHLK